MNKKSKKIACDECVFFAKSSGGLSNHKNRMHPYIPPPMPKKSTETSPEEFEGFSLLDGKHFELGDVFWHIRKCVITKITKTDGSTTVDVGTRITKRWYTQNKPD